jgi:hypothetical protein
MLFCLLSMSGCIFRHPYGRKISTLPLTNAPFVKPTEEEISENTLANKELGCSLGVGLSGFPTIDIAF